MSIYDILKTQLTTKDIKEDYHENKEINTSVFLAVGMLLFSMKLPALCAEDLPSAPMAFMVEKGIFREMRPEI